MADIFGRLGFMERQGSGFRKITETYYAAHNYRPELEPKFYSDITSFQVTLFNLNFNTETIRPDQQKVAFETHLTKLEAKTPTIEKALALYKSFSFDSTFSRADIIQMFHIAPSSAGKLLNKMKKAGLIEPVTGQGKGKYRFVQQ